MANTGEPTALELLLLRFFYEIDLGGDPCQPVSWQFLDRATASLVRHGLVAPGTHVPTTAGEFRAADLLEVPPRCAHLSGHRCERDPRR